MKNISKLLIISGGKNSDWDMMNPDKIFKDRENISRSFKKGFIAL